jgi:hypothetical protein
MSRNIRAAAPPLYAAALVVGFLINGKAGIIIAIGGATLLAAVFTLMRGPAGTGKRD